MRRTTWLGLAGLLPLITATPAQAGQASTPAAVYSKFAAARDPVAVWRGLSSDQRSAYRQFMTPASVVLTRTKAEPVSGVQAAAGVCWKRGYVRAAYNVLGVRLWSWTQYVTWCGTGLTIADATMRSVGEVNVLFWSWREVSHSLYVFRSQLPQRLDAFSQAEFKSCIFADIGCVLYRYPWIDMDGDATGWHQWSAGG